MTSEPTIPSSPWSHPRLDEWRQAVDRSETLFGFNEWLRRNTPREFSVKVKVTLERRIICTANNEDHAQQIAYEHPELFGLELPDPPSDVDVYNSDWHVTIDLA